MTSDGKPDRGISYKDTWKKMEAIYKAHPDKVKAIGVSNFSVKYLEELLKDATVVPAVNQIESHPYVFSPLRVHDVQGLIRFHLLYAAN